MGLALMLGCLPGDERPEPGNLLVTAVPTTATTEGFVTADGWTITFDRFVTAVGDIRLRSYPENSDSCNDYAETFYEWLFDFTKVGAPQKVGLVFGLGHCSVEFRFRAPSDETVLGVGANETLLAAMLLEGSDAFAEDERTALVATGRAERDGLRKRFDWTFRQSYEIFECSDGAGGFVSMIDLVGGVADGRTIEIRGEELFRAAPSDEAPFVFDPIAAADADGDDAITMSELAEVEALLDHPAWEEVPVEERPASLADLVYQHNLARIARMVGSEACQSELRDRR